MDTKKKLLLDFRDALESNLSIIEFKNSYYPLVQNEIKKVLTQNKIGLRLGELFSKTYDLLHSLEADPEIQDPEIRCLEQASEEIVINDLPLKDFVSISFAQVGDNKSLVFTLLPPYDSPKNNPHAARKLLKLAINKKKLFSHSILSCIITTFESYLEKLYRYYACENPSIYFKDKTIPFTSILDEKIEDIKKQIIDDDVERNLYDALAALGKIKDRNGINIDRYIQIQAEFEEIYYRRNIIVHADGVVNKTYLSKVNSKFTKNKKVGDVLTCDRAYLDQALSTSKKILCTLYYEVLRSINASADDFDVLYDVAYDSLVDEEYGFAEHLFTILKGVSCYDFEAHTLCYINYLIAKKQQNKSITEEISSLDVSAMTNNFKIAKECLLCNFETVYEKLKSNWTSSYPNGYAAKDVRDWPLFIDFRKSSYYEKLKVEYSSDFDEFEFVQEPSVDNSLETNSAC